MRADAKLNREHIIQVARAMIAEEGADVSMRDVARKADVGLATLFRHFPTREALLDVLLRSSLDELTETAIALEQSSPSDVALVSWLQEAVAFVRIYSGAVSMMAAALADEDCALHQSCKNLRAAGARLLQRAQADDRADKAMTGEDLFALIAAMGWIGDQPAFTHRSEYLIGVLSNAVLAGAPGGI